MHHHVIPSLGEPQFPSPLRHNLTPGDALPNFVTDDNRVLDRVEIDREHPSPEATFEKAGPREKIFFEASQVRAAIVTCGGLCPGMNNVIRSLVLELYHNYGVRDIVGIRYGFQGMDPASRFPLKILEPETVDTIDQEGGTILGSSRGNPPIPAMVEFLKTHRINILFTIGGDGTQRCALELSMAAETSGLKISVIGIPKTVDNDILYVDRTFGYNTAIDRAREVLTGAHMEARGFYNGIALVRLMGRDSGFIAAGATLASQEVNFTLIPEVPFTLEGEGGFLNVLKKRILEKHHALIVVAEGAGQDLLKGVREQDASGNILHKDIGAFLKERIAQYFKQQEIPVNLKYIDPSYFIRSVPADSEDCILCDQYARNAVHAAMSGRTAMIVGLYRCFIHVPMALAAVARQKVDLDSLLWRGVLSATGQPARFV